MQATDNQLNATSATTSAIPIDAYPAASPQGLARDFYATVFTLNLRVMRDLPQRLADVGLSPTQFKMLHRLLQQRDHEIELSVKALGEFHCLSLAAASRAIEGLHQRGYVAREECETDRRIKRVRITDAGRAVLKQIHQVNVDLLAEFTAELDERQRRDLAHAIAPLMEMLDVHAALDGAPAPAAGAPS